MISFVFPSLDLDSDPTAVKNNNSASVQSSRLGSYFPEIGTGINGLCATWTDPGVVDRTPIRSLK